jgi:membrane-bound lytic murein transglycosylase A
MLSSKKSYEIKNSRFHFGSKEDFMPLCFILLKKDDNDKIKDFFEKYFTPFKIVSTKNDSSLGTFTGYYRIELDGSKRKTFKYRYPVYKKPRDLKNGYPYYTREQIEKGALKGKGLEILWLRDIVDSYLLHIQGTGVVRLTNGDRVYLGFDGKNNREYS